MLNLTSLKCKLQHAHLSSDYCIESNVTIFILNLTKLCIFASEECLDRILTFDHCTCLSVRPLPQLPSTTQGNIPFSLKPVLTLSICSHCLLILTRPIEDCHRIVSLPPRHLATSLPPPSPRYYLFKVGSCHLPRMYCSLRPSVEVSTLASLCGFSEAASVCFVLWICWTYNVAL